MNIVEFVERVQNTKLLSYQKIILENLEKSKKPVLPKSIPQSHRSYGNHIRVSYIDEFINKSEGRDINV